MQKWQPEAFARCASWCKASVQLPSHHRKPQLSSDPQPNTYTVSRKRKHWGEECNSSLANSSQMLTKVSTGAFQTRARCRGQRFSKKKKKMLLIHAGAFLCFFLVQFGEPHRYMPVEVRQGESIGWRWMEEMAARKILDILSLSVRTLISSSPVLALIALITPDHLGCHVWNMSHIETWYPQMRL